MFRRKKILGLDLGRRNIKGVYLRKEGESISLLKYFFYDQAKESATYPTSSNVQEMLTICIQAHDLMAVPTVVGLERTALHSVDLPDLPLMPREELQQAVAFALENRYQVNLNEIYSDYYVLPQYHLGEAKTQTVKLFYADRVSVEEQAELLRRCAVKPAIIDVDILAISTMLVFNQYVQAEKSYIIVDMGEVQTTVALQIGEQLVAADTFFVAVQSISQAVANQVALSYQECERYKNSIALESGEIDRPEIQQICQESYVEILKEIQNRMDQYQAYFERWPLGAIYFVGGGCKLYDCLKLFSDKYGVEVTIPNPFKNINLHQSNKFNEHEIILKEAYHFASAVGFALRGLLSNED